MIVERLRLDGRCVVVAGAGGGGIGTRTAQALLEAGAHVVGVDRDPQEPIVAALTEAGAPVERYTGVTADVTTDDGVAHIVATASAITGSIHGLVNVVGGALVPNWAPSTEYTREQWHQVMAMNAEYVLFLGKAVAEVMIAGGHGGAIVNLASTSGLAASPYHIAYGAAKAAVVALTRTMAVEWGHHGIRVNCVSPGTITTPRAGATEPDGRDRLAIPLGRRGDPSEIAAAALFLVSDLSSYVSGQVLPVDGGMSWKWAHLGMDNEPIFVNNVSIRQRMGLA